MNAAGGTSRALDTTGLQPLYLLRPPLLAWRVLAGVLGALTGSTVFRLLDDPRDPGVQGVAIALLAVVAAVLVLRRRFPAAVLVAAEGVRLRTGWRFGPLVPWSQVADVRPAGRWDEEPSIRLPQGGHLRRRSLAGMPDEDVQRLAAALRSSLRVPSGTGPCSAGRATPPPVPPPSSHPAS
ncbi:hypothetical protein OG218_25655 [Kineococcus sp. NBC_00420]|uniref:hypothetical protein n=1 Tax=Kineococcus sp. NBC_00420 TaxID=2903564 RepID=UPI002E22197A